MFGKLRSIFGGGGAEDIDEVAEVEVDQDDIVVNKQTAEPPPAPDASAIVLPAGGGAEETMLHGELRAAQKIQMSLAPKTFPPVPGCLPFDLYAILEPAREIGGDFYDFWLNGRENLVMAVGDVSGKGIPAALFMAVCRTYLRAFSRSVGDPAKLVEYLNNEVSRHNESCMFVTLVCAVVHIPTGKVTYANAGHNPPFVRRADGKAEMLALAGDAPVGFMNGVEFETRSLTLGSGDSMLFYTDGMPEAFNTKREMLGNQAALALFADAARGGSCRTAVGQIRAEISEFAGGADPSDDLTLMMYGQLRQDMTGARPSDGDMSDALKGETSIFSLDRTGSGNFGGEDLGRSLSGISDRSQGR